jgi:hypothetical protein
MEFAVLVGEYFEDQEVYGPFESEDEAREYALEILRLGRFQIIPMRLVSYKWRENNGYKA